ncbi:MAG: glycoside hydrolase family 3 C-terminal domain-containing protein [Alistipes sp.]|nr:glycoside hydrolase family 3 C-terminal domain-containing protein [Alistipes sp.]
MMLSGCSQKWTSEDKGSHIEITQRKGATLGYSASSGVQILTKGGYAFKDLNRNGKLDVYEDWRKPVQQRAEDLASQMSVEQIAGLMLYSAHQAVPTEQISEAQMKFLTEDNLRHVLVTRVGSPEIAAKWSNNVQAYVEGIGLGIPANNSSDPRHSAGENVEYYVGASGDISYWPSSLGIAATFDPAVMEQFGKIASEEYRALGIATALSPQIDIATEPRWSRFNGTFGEDPDLSTDMARAYVDGFQTSEGDAEIDGGWGFHSVNAMIKHWPGGGAGEGGRDAHYSYGKYAVFPGGRLADHMQPFTEGAFKLNGKTGMATAVMPYYTISTDIDKKNGENVGNAFSEYLINDVLRGEYGFEGVVCTDWGVTKDNRAVNSFGTTSWGVEHLTVAERHYKLIKAGVDMFGGNNDKGPVLEAYEMGVKEMGEEWMRARMEKTAVRLLLNVFRLGLFENPYLDVEDTKATVGNPDFMKAGYDAQLRSIVMLKNKGGVLPLAEKAKVYVPEVWVAPRAAFRGNMGAGARAQQPQQQPKGHWEMPVPVELLSKYFTVVKTPAEADFAIVFVDAPANGTGYDPADVAKGGNGYMPISLQYNDYTATHAREVSLAGGDPLESFTNRSYKGKTVKTSNKDQLDLILKTRRQMGSKPVIVQVDANRPMVMSEFEGVADAILFGFSVQKQAVLDILSGKAEPTGLLPMQLPADMQTVEEQLEDVTRDMRCHVDSEGNTYDFAFGMNWKGVINDARTEKYK